MEGSHRVTVVDEYSKAIQDIVVLPLYKSSYGIGIGPDGRGPWSSSEVFTKPCRFSSGEDLMSKQIQGRGIIIPPYIFIGTSKYVDNWLFIKKGYAPLVVSREMIYSGSPIVMSLFKNEDTKKYIDILLSTKPDQTTLKKIFNSRNLKEDIKIEMDAHGVALLEANR
jgi:hypothetical protein